MPKEEAREEAEKVKEAIREEAQPALWYALEKDPELASKIISGIFEGLVDLLLKRDEELRAMIIEVDKRLSARIEELDRRLSARIEEIHRELSERIEKVNSELSARIEEVDKRLSARIEEVDRRLSARLEELSKAVEKTGEQVRALSGHVARIEGELVEMGLLNALQSACSPLGLVVIRLPRDPFRVDAAIIGPGLLALVEIAKTGQEADLEQLVEGAKTYERIHGERPDLLLLFIYAERPRPELVELARSMGIIVENSPLRIAGLLKERMEGA